MSIRNPFSAVAIPAWQSGRYYFLNNGTLAAVNTLTNGIIRASPVWVPSAGNISRLGAEVVAAGDNGCKLRLGLYADDGSGRPGSLLLDAGVIAGDSATVQEITISQVLAQGWYWAAAAVQGVTTTQPGIRCSGSWMPFMDMLGSIPGVASYPVSFVSPTTIGTLGTPLPASFGTPSSISTSGIRTFVKVA